MIYRWAFALFFAAALPMGCRAKPSAQTDDGTETSAAPVAATAAPSARPPIPSTVPAAKPAPAPPAAPMAATQPSASPSSVPASETAVVSPIQIQPPEGVTFVRQKEWQKAEPDQNLLNSMTHAENAPVLDIVLMHTGVLTTSDNELEVLQNIHFAHIQRGWGDITAHYLVGPSGKIYQGRAIWYRLPKGTSVADGMGRFNFFWGKCAIMLMGNFSDPAQEFTPDAKDALTILIEDLQNKLGTLYRDELEARQAETRRLLGSRDKDVPLDHDRIRLIFSPSLPASARNFKTD